MRTSDCCSRAILGPEALARYIINLRRSPGQNFIRNGCSSIKPCERDAGDERGQEVGRSTTGPRVSPGNGEASSEGQLSIHH